MPYFGATPRLGAPLSSMAAKLLYVSRRELQGVAAPPHLPESQATAPPGWRGPTRADYLTLNEARGAPVPKRARWDWDQGFCCLVGEQQQAEGQGPGDGPSKKHDVIIPKVDPGGGSVAVDRAEGDSRRWDTLWWRMRLCKDIYSPKPRFEAGSVYDPGCMRGKWKGKIYVSTAFYSTFSSGTGSIAL